MTFGRPRSFEFSSWFERQFDPFEDGFVFYTNARKGGRFVSADEYQALKANYARVFFGGLIGIPITIVVALAGLWVLSAYFELPDGSVNFAIYGILAVWTIAGVWSGEAPRRLVRNRTFVTPPKAYESERRAALAKVEWPAIPMMCAGGGMMLAFNLMRPDKGFGSWLWVMVGAVLVLASILIGYRKLRED